MCHHRILATAAVFVLSIFSADLASGLEFELGQSTEELKLRYDLDIQDHKTGRVTIVFRLEDEGRLAPLTNVQFSIPALKKEPDGGYYSDLSVSLALREEGGKRVARIHLLREFAERGEINLHTRTLDGKQEPLTGYYHSIQLKKYLVEPEQPKNKSSVQ